MPGNISWLLGASPTPSTERKSGTCIFPACPPPRPHQLTATSEWKTRVVQSDTCFLTSLLFNVQVKDQFLLQLKLNILSNVGVGGWCPVSPGPCHGQQRCPGPGRLGPAPLPLPVVGALTLRCRPHPGVPAALASLLEQTTNTGRVYVLSQRSSQSPGFTAWPAGPWAQPGCDYAEPRGRLHRCPGKGSAGLLDPRARCSQPPQHPCHGPAPPSSVGRAETASCSGSLWVLQALSSTLGTPLIKALHPHAGQPAGTQSSTHSLELPGPFLQGAGGCLKPS